MKAGARLYALHGAVIAVLLALNFLLPAYHHGLMARILVLATFAMGYNLTFGYGGLLSLGHAMFFAAGLYGAGLSIQHLGFGVPEAFLAALACGALLALVVGVLALRTTGVAFMIVTLMFSQAVHLAIIYFSAFTGGDQGLMLRPQQRRVETVLGTLNLTDPNTRYLVALALFTVVLFLMLALVRSGFGRVLVAIRENEERTRMLGYDTFSGRLAALVVSGTVCAAAGAAYGILFGYVGANFASVQYSILPLLWVLLGGAATTLGPLFGTVFMYYVVDIASGYTSAYMLVVGVVLILLVLFFRKGLLGTVRERWLRWLP
ncbi:branched-chain amino acid ABC transporter permease [Aquamicrobium sp. NLF2-7]|uniref:branched-chain amino acid ABC transporter permease n=1 Tax=unclassified Aquamicrobium TaxID=2618194 RepID=UPI001EFBA899|nr:branched-chain amino acid ABC transporter permease [Aquamicrobium sp.]MCG8272052.1 branched-chain amino acid ABC transporter permease [Aquamicrobium sp. NLF2-7]MCK9549903.1 branched-chain amino acid ABC transporter permease [Aquamicrobium sp.]